METWGYIVILFIFLALPLAVIVVICMWDSPQKLPIVGGVYRITSDHIEVIVIDANRKKVTYQFNDPDDYNKIKEGSMTVSEFNNIFTYIYTDYKTLVYKINSKR